MQYKVKLSGVSKQYTLYRTNTEKLFDLITPKSMKKNKQRNFYALKDISLEIKDGETIGIVGINGSGKSTLSNVLSNVIPPTTGKIDINGEPSLIAINVGLNNNLSGLDNIELKLLMHGFSRNEIRKLITSIKEFADIGDFMDQPVKKYSSGMKSRLGFAISVHTNPDLLIVDEALSVGDKTFYQKCLDKITEFKEQGKTIIFISHSMGQIKSISDRVLWLHNGQVKEFGETKAVLNNYDGYITWFNKLSIKEKQNHKLELKEKRSTLIQDNKNDNLNLTTPKNDEISLPSRYKNKKRQSKTFKVNNFFVQLSIILLAFLISTILLLLPTPEKGINSLIKENQEYETASKEINEAQYDEEKNGIIAVNEATIYSDEELNDVEANLPFGSELIILGENDRGNAYYFKHHLKQFYINKNEIKLVMDKEVLNVSLDDIVESFPSKFSDHYLYFLTQLGNSKEEVLTNLIGVDDIEVKDEFGFLYLNFPHENFLLKVNSEQEIVALIAKKGESIENPKFENIDYFTINEYEVLVNQKEGIISFFIDTQ